MQTYITLNDSTKIPQFGLGVYQVPEGEATYNTVLDALKMGVRHIDTAHAYQNERSVGKAVKVQFVFIDTNASAVLTALQYLSVMVLFAYVGFILQMLLKRNNKTAIQ